MGHDAIQKRRVSLDGTKEPVICDQVKPQVFRVSHWIHFQKTLSWIPTSVQLTAYRIQLGSLSRHFPPLDLAPHSSFPSAWPGSSLLNSLSANLLQRPNTFMYLEIKPLYKLDECKASATDVLGSLLLRTISSAELICSSWAAGWVWKTFTLKGAIHPSLTRFLCDTVEQQRHMSHGVCASHRSLGGHLICCTSHRRPPWPESERCAKRDHDY